MKKIGFYLCLFLLIQPVSLFAAEGVTRIVIGQRTDTANYSDKDGIEVGKDQFVSTSTAFEKVGSLGNSNWGYNFLFMPLMKNKAELKDFPKKNNTSEVESLKHSLLLGFFYRWGDALLGKNGEMAFRVGMQWGKAYTQLKLNHNGQEHKTSKVTDESGLFFAFDWGPFSVSVSNSSGFTDGSLIEFEDLTDDDGDEAKLKTSNSVTTFGFSYYF